MKARLCKKRYKQDGGFLWNSHDQINHIQLSSRLFKHQRFTPHKFPHRKWAEARYFENNKGDKL